ncbi:MAG: Threonine--tRNA ligase 2 [Chlamydiae bacterium]|nr:Threonine--tRNA ligase 2 [Chlamydiota bacterium]
MEKDQKYPLIALRQCAARLVAAAVCRLFPKSQIIKGEATDSGFFYDFVLDTPITPDVFPMIEEHLRVLMTEDTSLRSHTMMRENAQELFEHHNQPRKSEFLPQEQLVDILQIGDFYDECPEPHPESLKIFGAIELLDVKNIFISDDLEVTRIVGTVFHDKNELKKFLKSHKQIKDHQEICREKGFFHKIDDVSDGEWFIDSRGIQLIEAFKALWRGYCREEGVQEISSPGLQDRYFLEHFGQQSSSDWALPGTLAPAHFEYMVKTKPKGVFRVGEFCRLYQSVQEHLLVGLLRTRGYWIDQEHIFCQEPQVLEELISSLHFIKKSNKMLSIEGEWVLNSFGRVPKKSLREWERSHELLIEAFEKSKMSSESLKEGGDGNMENVTFTGPRLEYHFIDGLGRRWRGPYLGIWTTTPKKQNLWMIERSIFGSVERVLALLLEKGPLPSWLKK